MSLDKSVNTLVLRVARRMCAHRWAGSAVNLSPAETTTVVAVIGIGSREDALAACLAGGAGCGAPQPRQHRRGVRRLVACAKTAGAERVGIEGSGNYGRPAASALTEAGLDVVEAPPQTTAVERKGRRTGTKTDAGDALAAARTAGRDHHLLPPRPEGPPAGLHSTVKHRREPAKARNQQINRLHADPEQTRLGCHRPDPL